jgi:hypothetical protein
MTYNPISGLAGRYEADTLNAVPPAWLSPTDMMMGNKKVINPHGALTSLPLANMTNITNRGGARGVLPCGHSWNYMRVLRREAGNKYTGLYPQTAYGRNQSKGLASLPQKPINLPIMSITSSVNAALPSAIKGSPSG